MKNIEDDANIPDYRLVNDYSIRFDSYQNYMLVYLMVIPTISFFCVLFPFFIFSQLLKYKRLQLLNDREILFRYGFFFYSYKEKSFYWDLTFLFRKILFLFIVSFSQFFDYFSNERPLLIITILLLCVSSIRMILNRIKPYKQEFKIVMILEDSSLITISLTLILLSLLILISSKDEDYFLFILWISFIICIVTINCFFFIFFGYYYLKQGDSIENRLRSLFSLMPKKFLEFGFISKIAKKYSVISYNSEKKEFIDEKEKMVIEKSCCNYSPSTRVYFRKKSEKLIDFKRREFKKILNHCISQNPKDFFKYRFAFVTFEGGLYRTLIMDDNVKIKIKYLKNKENKSLDFSVKIIYQSYDDVEIDSELNFSNHLSYKK